MEQIFSKPNIIYWVGLCLVIILETWLSTNPKPPYQKKWPGPKRWWLGWTTLFGSSLAMVAIYNWHFWTWLGLTIATALMRQLRPHTALGNLWRRQNREYQRWTLSYFLAFVLCIPGIAFGIWDAATWILIFFSLGVCGASKVGWETWFYSLKAEELRRKKAEIEEVQHGPAN